jgi:hypothetical protein
MGVLSIMCFHGARTPSVSFADTSPVNGGGIRLSQVLDFLPPFTGEVSPEATKGVLAAQTSATFVIN